MFEKMIRKARKNEKGFTLVELMVVVVIIGILTAIAIPQFGNVTNSAEQRAVEGNLRTLEGAGILYRAETGSFPSGDNLYIIDHDGWKDNNVLEDYVREFAPAKAEQYKFYNESAWVFGEVGGVNITTWEDLPIYWEDYN